MAVDAHPDINAVVVAGVSRRFGDVIALDDVTVSFGRNRVTGLLGRNGAGKSTLIDLMTARAPGSSGSITVLGADPWENRATLSQLCSIGESQAYPAGFTVDAVLAGARLLHPRWDESLAADLVGAFTLPRGRKIGKLSRGQRSALGVVIGLAARAPITVFDEPYVGLDAVARELFYDRLVADVATHPRTVILSSHLIDEVADLLEHVVVLDRGRVVLDGPVDDIRGTVVELVGPRVTVDAFTRCRDVLQRRDLAGLTRVTVRGADPAAAAAAGLRPRVLSLQDVVVALSGAGDRLAPAETGERVA